jgi:hypothetical protein
MLGDPFSRFSAIGGLLIVAGLLVTAIDLDGGLRAPPKPPGAAGRE